MSAPRTADAARARFYDASHEAMHDAMHDTLHETVRFHR